MLAIRFQEFRSRGDDMAGSYDDIGIAFVERIFSLLVPDIAAYGEAAIQEAYAYCLKEFKKACKREEIEWKDEWNEVLPIEQNG